MNAGMRRWVAGALVLLAGTAAVAQWNPATGQWGKTEPTDVRVMTYNIRDHICRNAVKAEGYNGWCALARVVAAMKPDVLMLQEAGDNDGNGTTGGNDTVDQLTITLGLFLRGGTDPFLPGGPVGAYVQKYAPDYDLPYVWVSSVTDGYNRNVILSRFPFADLNGDGVSQRPSPATISADAYAWGGNGGIRGFMFAEFDLPDAVYAGDLVIGNAHLQSGGTSSDLSARERAARNVAYYIDYLLNGAGGTLPDPNNKIADVPPATRILNPQTPVIIGGDWNEDEAANGRKGPAEWLTQAEAAGGTDGTDRDRTDMLYDASVEPRSNTRTTQNSGSKLDYIAWQDSIATLRRSFIFYSNELWNVPSWIPPELIGFPNAAYWVSSVASDHRPVIADFILPAAPMGVPADLNCDGVVNFDDIDPFVLALSGQAGYEAAYPACRWLNGDLNGDGAVNFDDFDAFVAALAG